VTWNLACPDWEQRMRAGRAPITDLPLTSHGDRAVAVYDKLRLSDVDGTPALADASGAWFREIVRAMFGGYDPVTRTRYIRELFALVPKKNSKTTYGALGLMLVALLLNQRPRAPFLMTAPVQDVADMAFASVEGAIALDPVLEKKLWVRGHLKEIIHRETKAKLEIITFDPKVVTGKKVVGALIDEVHVLGKMARADKALLQLRGGMQPFPEAFLAMITTQSDETPAGVFKDELQKAREIRDGKRAGTMLPVLYEFPEEMQQDKQKPWRDPANWPMVTPNLGLSVDLPRLIAECLDEEAKGEGQLRTWASQHLNIQIGLALMANAWAGAAFWEAAGEVGLTFESLLERSEVVVAGIDGGGLDDLLGLCILGRERVETEMLVPAHHDETGTLVPEQTVRRKRWLAWHRAWAHKIVLERRQDIAPRLLDFVKDGDLVLVPEPGDDVRAVAELICQVRDAGLLPEKNAIGVDAAGIGDILDELTADHRGIQAEQIIGISQGWRLTGAIKSTERKLAGRQLVHAGMPLMAWSVGNAKAEAKGNATSITKQISGTAKIDPLMATFDAVSLMALNPAAMVIGEDYELTVA
jgi:phage terminase large subunit-like protein